MSIQKDIPPEQGLKQKRELGSYKNELDSEGHSTRTRIETRVRHPLIKVMSGDSEGHSTRTRIETRVRHPLIKVMSGDSEGHSTRTRIETQQSLACVHRGSDSEGHSTRTRIETGMG